MFSYGVKKLIMEHLTLFYINNVNCFEKKNLKIHLHTNVWPSSRSQPAPFSCCVFIPDLTFDLSLCAFVHDLQRRKKHKQNTFLLRSLKPFSHISEPLFTQGNHEAFWVTPPPPPPPSTTHTLVRSHLCLLWHLHQHWRWFIGNVGGVFNDPESTTETKQINITSTQAPDSFKRNDISDHLLSFKMAHHKTLSYS